MPLDSVDYICKSLNNYGEKKGLEIHLFNIDWYNAIVGPKFILNYSTNTLAALVISQPSMFEKCFVPFVDAHVLNSSDVQKDLFEDDNSSRSNVVSTSDPLDQCMKAHFQEMTKLFPELEVDVIHDFDMTPTRRPKVLVQTAGHVSGAVYMYRLDDLKNHLSNINENGSLISSLAGTSDQKIFPVCLHPRFGGWFALRGVLIFKCVKCPSLARPIPRSVLQSPEEIMKLLELYNTCWRDNAFRDVIPVEEKYSAAQQKYFATPPAQRIELLREILDK